MLRASALSINSLPARVVLPLDAWFACLWVLATSWLEFAFVRIGLRVWIPQRIAHRIWAMNAMMVLRYVMVIWMVWASIGFYLAIRNRHEVPKLARFHWGISQILTVGIFTVTAVMPSFRLTATWISMLLATAGLSVFVYSLGLSVRRIPRLDRILLTMVSSTWVCVLLLFGMRRVYYELLLNQLRGIDVIVWTHRLQWITEVVFWLVIVLFGVRLLRERMRNWEVSIAAVLSVMVYGTFVWGIYRYQSDFPSLVYFAQRLEYTVSSSPRFLVLGLVWAVVWSIAVTQRSMVSFAVLMWMAAGAFPSTPLYVMSASLSATALCYLCIPRMGSQSPGGKGEDLTATV